jgi:adenylyltransferase/sulfurtransferase
LGGLGGISATYLAAAGVGNIKLVDSDKVELSNLNRQILYGTDDIGKPKAVQAAKRLSALNPEIKIQIMGERITESNAEKLISGCDIIIDGLDNHQDRLILNRASYNLKIPFIYGAINEWQGQVSFFNPPNTPCLACLLPNELKSPGPIPVFGALPGTIGTLQATLTMEYLMKGDTVLAGNLLIYHADTMAFETISFDKNPRCPVCGS